MPGLRKTRAEATITEIARKAPRPNPAIEVSLFRCDSLSGAQPSSIAPDEKKYTS